MHHFIINTKNKRALARASLFQLPRQIELSLDYEDMSDAGLNINKLKNINK